MLRVPVIFPLWTFAETTDVFRLEVNDPLDTTKRVESSARK
jgi:hypothetical protein